MVKIEAYLDLFTGIVGKLDCQSAKEDVVISGLTWE